jgi:hypothetical protein
MSKMHYEDDDYETVTKPSGVEVDSFDGKRPTTLMDVIVFGFVILTAAAFLISASGCGTGGAGKADYQLKTPSGFDLSLKNGKNIGSLKAGIVYCPNSDSVAIPLNEGGAPLQLPSGCVLVYLNEESVDASGPMGVMAEAMGLQAEALKETLNAVLPYAATPRTQQ